MSKFTLLGGSAMVAYRLSSLRAVRLALQPAAAAALLFLVQASPSFAAEGKPLDELIIGSITDVSVPDPNIIGVQQFIFTDNVFDTLIRYTAGIKPQPGLASTWSWNADKPALTLQPRQRAKFPSGAEFTAED